MAKQFVDRTDGRSQLGRGFNFFKQCDRLGDIDLIDEGEQLRECTGDVIICPKALTNVIEGYRKCTIRLTLLSFDIAFRTAQTFTVFYREGLIFNISAPDPLRSNRTCFEGIDKSPEILETDVVYSGSYLKNGEILHGNYRPLIALPLYHKEFKIVHPLCNRYLRESEIKSLLNESSCDVKIISLEHYVPNRLSNWLAAQVYYCLHDYWKGKEDYGFWHNMNEWEIEPYDLESNQKICDMFHYRPRVPYNPLPEGVPNRKFV